MNPTPSTTTNTTPSPEDPLGLLGPAPGSDAGAKKYGLSKELAGLTVPGTGALFGGGDDLTVADTLSAFESLGGNDAGAQLMAQIQLDLFRGGFYPTRYKPTPGVFHSQDLQAFEKAALHSARAGADLSDYLETTGNFGTASGFGPAGLLQQQQQEQQQRVISLPNSEDLAAIADDAFKKTLGRKPTDAERRAFSDSYQGSVGQYYKSVYAAQDAYRAQFQGVDIQSLTAGPNPNEGVQATGDIISGARGKLTAEDRAAVSRDNAVSPDSVFQYGTQIANLYGLHVTSWKRSRADQAALRAQGAHAPDNSDHTTGMAVDIAGPNLSAMQALYRWAKGNEGPGKLFRYVEPWDQAAAQGTGAHVHLSFNSALDPEAVQALHGVGAQTPTTSADNFGGQLQSFMGALRLVEQGGRYDWKPNRAGAKGAYQFTNYESWAKEAGIDPSDHSSEAQDAVAAFKIAQYYKRYGDWRLVAMAWLGGPGSVDKVQRDPAAADRISDGNLTLNEYANRVLTNFAGPGGGTGNLAPGQSALPVFEEEKPASPSTAAEDFARQQNPVEAQQHSFLGAYDNLIQLIGSPIQFPRSQ